MVRLYRSNATSADDADIVIIGVQDESGSHAKRKGTSRAPDVLRVASNESEFFERGGTRIPTCTMRGSFDGKKVFDGGNLSGRKEVSKLAYDFASKGKVPIFIGGDHSLTTEAIRGISSAIHSKLAILYFDAHPDFVSSSRNYYGSVLTDSSLSLDYKSSMMIGTRAAEPEELVNAEKEGVQIMNPLDIAEIGVLSAAEKIREKTKKSQIYISVDLDCLDPSFAPGVSVPSPGGLSSTELIFLLNKSLEGNVVGLDIVELCPDFDFNGMTASLAARILSECIASLPKK
ncbi:MAG TPA: arginase family protein [Nitrososphaera sp.]|nr:arginase family protein [Nitrososphaera sp.]